MEQYKREKGWFEKKCRIKYRVIDRERQREKDNETKDRKGQKGIERDRERQIDTERDRERQRETERDRKGQKNTERV